MKKPTIAHFKRHIGLIMFRCMALVLVLFSLGGCGQDYSLSPPQDSEKVTVTIKVPNELVAEPLQVMYRSTYCKRAYRGASGQRLEENGIHGFDMPFERQGQTNLYQVKLPVNGGGACKWRLSNVMFGVNYGNPANFGEDVTWGAGGGILVKFDRNRSMRGSGSPKKIDGDLNIKKDYYPWVHERFLGGNLKYVSLAGEGDIYLDYQALQAREVYFEPVFHSAFIVRSEGVRVKKEGNSIKFTYPDGSITADGRSQPDFLKLQSIRTGRIRECFSIIRYYKCPDRRPQLLPDLRPMPDKPGFGQYIIVDEWGNELPTYHYWLIGNDGRIYKGNTDVRGLTVPLPISVHPPRGVEFPARNW